MRMRHLLHYWARRLALWVVLIITAPGGAKAQNGMFYEADVNFNNVYLQTASNILMGIVNGALYEHDHPSLFPGLGYYYNYMPIKDNDDKVAKEQVNSFGFKGKDLFSWVNVDVKVGWFGRHSPVGLYGMIGYEHRRNHLCFQHDTEFGQYKTNALRPGIGIRLVPIRSASVVPVFEVGTTYNLILGARSPWGTDKKQFNSGMAINASIGVGWGYDDDKQQTISAGALIPTYDYFNKDWSSDGGYYFPYANVSAKNYLFYVKYSLYFSGY